MQNGGGTVVPVLWRACLLCRAVPFLAMGHALALSTGSPEYTIVRAHFDSQRERFGMAALGSAIAYLDDQRTTVRTPRLTVSRSTEANRQDLTIRGADRHPRTSSFTMTKTFSFEHRSPPVAAAHLFSLIWLSICQGTKGVWCECWDRFHFKEGVGAGRRRLISRGELVSRRLVMLICAGCPVRLVRDQDLSAFFLFTAALVQQSR